MVLITTHVINVLQVPISRIFLTILAFKLNPNFEWFNPNFSVLKSS